MGKPFEPKTHLGRTAELSCVFSEVLYKDF